MEKHQKPDWITPEQWEIKPNVYHWEQSLNAKQSLKQSQNRPLLTYQEMDKVAKTKKNSTKEYYDNLHKKQKATMHYIFIIYNL